LVGNNEKLIEDIDNALKQSDFEFQIECATNTSELEKSYKDKNFDMVLFDIDSNISYQEFIGNKRDFGERVTFVAILGRDSFERVNSLIKDGFDNYCFKEDIMFLAFVVYKEITYEVKKNSLDCFDRELVKEIERLAFTIESIGDGVITTDHYGNIIMINKAAIEITGWTRNEAIGKPLNTVFNLFDKKTGNPAENPFERVMKERLSLGLNENTVLISKEGRELYVSANTAPIIDAEDTVIGVVVVFRDITRVKKNEEELKKLSMVVKHSPSLVLMADADGNVEYANPKFMEVSGYSLEEIKEKGFFGFAENENISLTDIAEETDWHGEFKLRKKNGEITWQWAAVSAIRNSEGIITNWIGISEDITERKKYEDKLANEQRNLQTIFDTAPVGMLIIDSKRNVKKANFAFANIVHKTIDEICGKKVGEIICCKNFISSGRCGENEECNNCKFRQGLYNIIDNKNILYRMEFSYPIEDVERNEILWLSINAVPVILDEEECALIVIEDITLKKKGRGSIRMVKEFLYFVI